MPNNKLRFECHYCPSSFDSFSELVSHYESQHNPEIRSPKKLKETTGWQETKQLHSLVQMNLELAIAELSKCEEEIRECLARLDKAQENLKEAKDETFLV